jgi:hypothetical protein
MTWKLWTGARERAFVSTMMNFTLQKFYELRKIPNNCAFATKCALLIRIYIPLNFSFEINHFQGISNTKKKHNNLYTRVRSIKYIIYFTTVIYTNMFAVFFRN